jgi:cytidine deaminase
MIETARATTAATVAGAEVGAARRRSRGTLGAALEMVVMEVTVKAEVVVVVAVVNLEERELRSHTNSW